MQHEFHACIKSVINLKNIEKLREYVKTNDTPQLYSKLLQKGMITRHFCNLKVQFGYSQEKVEGARQTGIEECHG